jgi:outer membrane protein assembly factor BamB
MLWDILIGDKITSSPAVAGGKVYIGSHNGKLYAVK